MNISFVAENILNAQENVAIMTIDITKEMIEKINGVLNALNDKEYHMISIPLNESGYFLTRGIAEKIVREDSLGRAFWKPCQRTPLTAKATNYNWYVEYIRTERLFCFRCCVCKGADFYTETIPDFVLYDLLNWIE